MKYESSILKRLIDTYGVIGNPRYLSEIIKEFIVRGKELYPQLFTYQSDWLAHIDEFGLTPEYTVSYTGQHIYAPNTKEKPVKSAILTGQTLVNVLVDYPQQTYVLDGSWQQKNLSLKNTENIKPNTEYTFVFHVSECNMSVDGSANLQIGDDGFFNNPKAIKLYKGLNTFKLKTVDSELKPHMRLFTHPNSVGTLSFTLMLIEGDYTNVDIPYFNGMQSVKMPVLTTCGKNLFNLTDIGGYVSLGNGVFRLDSYHGLVQDYKQINLEPNTQYTLSFKSDDANSTWLLVYIGDKKIESSRRNVFQFTTDSTGIIKLKGGSPGYVFDNKLTMWDVQLEKGTQATPYEPYKSNILTVNEDVTLRSNGDICDELNLLTGQLTQRIGEDGVVLSQVVVKTVDLTIHDKEHQKVERLTTFKGGTHFITSSQDGSLLPTLVVEVVTDLEETLMVCSLEGNTM